MAADVDMKTLEAANPGRRYTSKGGVLQHTVKAGRRKLSESEAERCVREIDGVLKAMKREKLNVSFAVTETSQGFPLAVYAARHRDGAQTYGMSSSLLATGRVHGEGVPRSISWAERRLLGRPKEWTECVTPPCHQHVLVDVGAHIGWWAFSAAKRGWRVLAVEADPVNLKLLELSKCLNPLLAPLITVADSLVAGKSGRECVIAVPGKHLGNGTIVCTLNKKEVKWTPEDVQQLLTHSHYVTARRYSTATLEEIVKPLWDADGKMPARASVLRLDIGGVGSRVLESMQGTLKAGRYPIIIRDDADDQVDLLTASGYTVRPEVCHMRPHEKKADKASSAMCAFLPLPDRFEAGKEADITHSRRDRSGAEHAASPKGRYGEREITQSETAMCIPEIAKLASMGVEYGIVQTIKGFTLAVQQARTGDRCSGELLSHGRCEEGVAFRAFEMSRSVVDMLDPMWRTCTQPPCHEHLVIDVGAHTGWWAFSAAARGWKVIAVEPSPISFALLQLSACLNPELKPYISLHHKIVTGRNRTCVYYTVPGNMGNRVKCLSEEREWTDADTAALPDAQRSKPTVYRVPTMTMGLILDLQWNKDPQAPRAATFLRVNVAGVEERALLESMHGFVDNNRVPFIWSDMHGNQKKEDYLQFLTEHGYTTHMGDCLSGKKVAAKDDVPAFATELGKGHNPLCSRLDLARLAGPKRTS